MRTIRLLLLSSLLLPFAGCSTVGPDDYYYDDPYWDTGYTETPLQVEIESFHASVRGVNLEDEMTDVVGGGRTYGTSTAFSIAATEVDMPLPEQPGMPIDPYDLPADDNVFIDLCPIEDVIRNGADQSSAFLAFTVCSAHDCTWDYPTDLQIDIQDTPTGRVVEIHADWHDGSELDTRLRYTELE